MNTFSVGTAFVASESVASEKRATDHNEAQDKWRPKSFHLNLTSKNRRRRRQQVRWSGLLSSLCMIFQRLCIQHQLTVHPAIHSFVHGDMLRCVLKIQSRSAFAGNHDLICIRQKSLVAEVVQTADEVKSRRNTRCRIPGASGSIWATRVRFWQSCQSLEVHDCIAAYAAPADDDVHRCNALFSLKPTIVIVAITPFRRDYCGRGRARRKSWLS